MLPWRRFATASPSALVSRLARPTPVSGKAAAVSVRGLAVTGNKRSLAGPSEAEVTKTAKRSMGPLKPKANTTRALRTAIFGSTDDKGVPSAYHGILERATRAEDVPTTSSAREFIVLKYKNIDEELPVSSLWLRDNCRCPQCVTPSSGQKTFHTHDLPLIPTVKDIEVVVKPEAEGRTTLRVVWARPGYAEESAIVKKEHEEHVSEYDTQELLHTFAEYQTPSPLVQLPRRLWDEQTIKSALKPVAYADWMAPDNGNNTEFYRGLLDLYQLGILIVDGVPDSENAVREIANQIGNIQTTFYGELFDVVSKPNAENVAYTNVFLCLHQDLLYMNDPPYIQLLHCLRNDCDGGESLFSDSVRAAVEMQLNDAHYLQSLASDEVRYHYERNGHYYFNQRPVLEFAGGLPGNPSINPSAMQRSRAREASDLRTHIIRNTGWSPPFQASHRFPLVFGNGPDGQPKLDTSLRRWAKAAKRFGFLLEHKDNMLEVKLQPGQCVLFNNRRVLHGRRQFNTSDGTRWLKGTYIDEQTFHSRVTDMLRRGLHLPGGDGQAALHASSPFRPAHTPIFDVAKKEQEQVLAMLRAKKPAKKIPEAEALAE
ncbi:hypothetical protein SEUCBS140593_005739 [Sporothrix eucalyptigena]|uniref:TauD/TfdA-like domain-containing protein n=1 Tax=Sporothrix eucalyptigena TaxID=1812306 RepID=A0ABP0C0W1_9PEZI